MRCVQHMQQEAPPCRLCRQQHNLLDNTWWLCSAFECWELRLALLDAARKYISCSFKRALMLQ